MEERINQLESLLALQDNTIQQLNNEVFRQQQDISRLLRRMERLETRLEEMAPSRDIAGQERPPHW